MTSFDFTTVAGWLDYIRDRGWSNEQAHEILLDQRAMMKKMILELNENGRPFDDLLDNLPALNTVLDRLAGPTSPPATRVFFTSKGERVESTLTDREAIELLGRCRSNFALSLYTQYNGDDGRGRNRAKKGLSSKQWPWVHKLALEQQARENPAPTPTVEASPLNLSDLLGMLKQAAAHLQWPTIAIQVEQGEIRFKYAKGGKVPGSVNIVNHTTRAYLGRIMPDGTVALTRSCTDDYLPLLADLAEDAAGVLATAGRMSTKCCFCRRDLVTDESVTAGYGPVCADHYGLPWG